MKNEKGFVLVLALMMMLVLTLIGLASTKTSIFEIKLAGNDLLAKKAFWKAESGHEEWRGNLNNGLIKDLLPDSIGWRYFLAKNVAMATSIGYNSSNPEHNFIVGATPPDSEDWSVAVVGQHKLDATNKVAKLNGKPIYVVTSHGWENQTHKCIEVEMVRTSVSPKTWSAVTANGRVNTTGNFTADGRDWDENGVTPLLNGQGVGGISTKDTVSLGGSSSIGGTVNGVDYAPPNKGLGNPGVVVEDTNQPLMTSPDNALGLPEGTLKSIAQSNGKYYANGSLVPSGTLSGVTFVNGDFATADGEGVFGEGVLIVTGTLGNFHGNFKGVIITNCVNKANGNSQIVGTIITLTSATADVLNGTCDVLFSRGRVKKSLDLVSKAKLIAWKEIF